MINRQEQHLTSTLYLCSDFDRCRCSLKFLGARLALSSTLAKFCCCEGKSRHCALDVNEEVAKEWMSNLQVDEADPRARANFLSLLLALGPRAVHATGLALFSKHRRPI